MVVLLKFSKLGILPWNCFKLDFFSFVVVWKVKNMTEQFFWLCYCMNWRRSYDDPAVHLWRIYDPHLLMQSKSEQSLKKFLREACLCSVKQFANRPYFWRILQEMLRLFKCKKSKMPTIGIFQMSICTWNSKFISSMHQCMYHLVLKAIEFQNWQEILSDIDIFPTKNLNNQIIFSSSCHKILLDNS